MSALIFLFLSSCSSVQAPWQLDEIVSHNPAYQSKRLLHIASNKNTGFDLEIGHILSEHHVHINVFSRQIPAYLGDLKKALITISNEKESRNMLVHRLEGGQRIFLGKDETQFLLASLETYKEVNIYLEGYEENIDTKDFTTLFSKFPSD